MSKSRKRDPDEQEERWERFVPHKKKLGRHPSRSGNKKYTKHKRRVDIYEHDEDAD